MNPTSVVGTYCPPSRASLAAASTFLKHSIAPYKQVSSSTYDLIGLLILPIPFDGIGRAMLMVFEVCNSVATTTLYDNCFAAPAVFFFNT